MNRIITMLFLLSGILLAQGTTDPASLNVFQADAAITVDGVLDEGDWSTDNPYLMYGIGAQPEDNASTPTGYAIVKSDYVDTTKTNVRFLYSGMDLFISLESNDKQVCRFGDSWEGDGLFMKIKDASGSDVEYKLYYNLAGADPEIHYEGPDHSEGAGAKGDGTIVNDSTNVDSGYTAELRISLSGLGFMSVPDSLEVLMNIFDPDNYNDGVGAWGANGSFAKQWWGSEWGPEHRYLVLQKEPEPVNVDPSSMNAAFNAEGVVIDGVLNAEEWPEDLPALKFQIGANGSDKIFVPTGSAIVKESYTDISTTYVKFQHDNKNLYISLNSDDQQVCRFGDSWEGDGLFMKIKDASGSDVEFKLYYNLAGTDPDIHYEGPDYGEGAAVKGTGTIVNDSTNVDGGYTAELKISLEGLGYSNIPDSLHLLMNIFDPDDYSDGVGAWGANGSYAKQWWGSEWGPDMRTLVLEKETDPQSLTAFNSSVPMVVDGVLDEVSWTADIPYLKFQIGGTSEGNAFMPTGGAVVKETYTDVSTTFVRFIHDADNLYISLESDDQQVCRFGDSWEGDGLFMKVKDATGTDVEFKLYYNLAGADPEIHYEGPAHSEGAGVKGEGTIVNDSTNVDGGYTAELRISLSGLGFANMPDSLQLLINVFDPDDYSDGVGAWGANGSYAKQWWGSEWGPDMRTVYLSDLTSVDDPASSIPSSFRVFQNYPNPFNPTTKIQFKLPATTDVKVEVFNSLGAKIATLANGKLSAGAHTLEWNGYSSSGQQAASGVYFYRVVTPKQSVTKKMLLIK